MDNEQNALTQKKYLRLLSEKYPTMRSLSRELINLSAVLNLPKGTEHFMSDIHGEYEAFCHILNNCSGVFRNKADKLFADSMTEDQRRELCTLIYYPKEKLRLLKKAGIPDREWYRDTIHRLIELAITLSSKYTRAEVRQAMPEDYAYILDELLHSQKDEDDNQILYHEKILETIIDIDADDFICSLSRLLKRLAVDRLHILGDIFDRGPSAEKVMDLLMKYHSLDITWGNHDILWMGACCGSEACIANVVRGALKYNTLSTLESGYGISLRNLALFAERTYPDMNPSAASLKAVSVIQFKLEGQVIKRHPEYEMNDRLLLEKVHSVNLVTGGETYYLNDGYFPTVKDDSPYELTEGEKEIIEDLRHSFLNSERLRRHIDFLYERGGMYLKYNGNLLYHGCIPMTDKGEFDTVTHFGKKLSGKEYLDFADRKARHAFFSKEKDPDELDFMWYLWSGRKSPLCGRDIKTFERTFIDDETAWHEEQNPYYDFYRTKKTCDMILSAFSLNFEHSHIINGHTPVRLSIGEKPVRAEGRLLVIDGGFCKGYHKTTGIAGYTLVFNSHGMSLKSHHPFESVEQALMKNVDIHSSSEIVETRNRRLMVADTDEGSEVKGEIDDLMQLLETYKTGEIKPM